MVLFLVYRCQNYRRIPENENVIRRYSFMRGISCANWVCLKLNPRSGSLVTRDCKKYKWCRLIVRSQSAEHYNAILHNEGSWLCAYWCVCSFWILIKTRKLKYCSFIIFFCFVVSSGTYTVNPDASVQIAAEEAVPLDHLDKDVSIYCWYFIWCCI